MGSGSLPEPASHSFCDFRITRILVGIHHHTAGRSDLCVIPVHRLGRADDRFRRSEDSERGPRRLLCVGAYSAAFAITLAGDLDYPDWVGFPIILVSAILVGLVLGFVIERVILRHMYHQDEVLIALATFGLFLVLEDIILLVFGVDPYFAYQPTTVLGGVSIIGVYRDYYSLSLLGVAVIVASFCWYGLTPDQMGQTDQHGDL